jgi:amino acid adenylation domain-containing protein
LAAFFALLYRYTGQADITLGTYSSGRSEGRFARTVGDLVNPVPIRARHSSGEGFRTLLGRVRSAMLGALEHADYPLALVIDALGLPRDASRSPLFQWVFVLQQASAMPALHPFTDGRGGGRLQLGGIAFESLELPQHKARFDVELMILAEAEGRYSALTLFNTDLFDAESIERLLASYATLLQGIVRDPDAMVESLPVLAPEHEAALARLNATQTSYPSATLPELVRAMGRERLDAVALEDANGSVTYGELLEASARLRHYLQARGVGSGARVGVLVDRSRELVAALLAVLEAGASYVPLDPVYPSERIHFILADAALTAVVTISEFGPLIERYQGCVVCLDTERSAIAQVELDGTGPTLDPDLPAYLLYTSGSTGRPKGVCVSHRSLVNFLVSMRFDPGIDANDVLVAVTTVSFDIAGLELFLPLLAGAKCVLCPRTVVADGVALARLLEDKRASMLQATPATFRLLLEAGWRGNAQFKILCGGEVLPSDLAVELARCGKLYNLYGPTETTIWSTLQRVDAVEPARTVPIGRPIANTQVYVVDQRLQPMPLGAVGELLIAGDGLALGYHNREELTAQRFVIPDFLRGRAYRTGDRVRVRSDGVLEFLGRNDGQVKINGYRIELGEIDVMLGSHEAIREAVTVLVPGPSGSSQLHAYFVAEQMVTTAELVAHLRRHLPEYMVPRSFERLDVLPRTPNNKIDRKALPVPRQKQHSHEKSRALSQAEKLVHAVWTELLEIESFDLDANFFDIGGNSLIMGRARARLHQLSGRDIPLVELYRNPTARGLAACLTNGTTKSDRVKDAHARGQAQRAAQSRGLGRRRLDTGTE